MWFFEKVSRGLIRVSGKNMYDFLQGLITNDISHIYRPFNADNAIFSMFLNKQGRVLYESIIYKQKSEQSSCLIECDQLIEEQLKQHLLRFRLRKCVDIDIITNEMNVWACFQDERNARRCTELNLQGWKYRDLGVTVFFDPRHLLGLRIVAPKNMNIEDFQGIYDERKCLLSNTAYNYEKQRYILGVSEGVKEIPPAKNFPFEVNCDYLQGISFQKGCYLGQEFTARTYHTGVIRKRIMPLYIPNYSTSQVSSSTLNIDDTIVNEKYNIVGKLKGIQNEYGIGLLKTELALSSEFLKIGNFTVFTERPFWWP